MTGLSATAMRVKMLPALPGLRDADHVERWFNEGRLARRLPRRGSHLTLQGDRSPPTALELGELILRVANSADRQAFEQLFRHFAPRVKAYLMRAGTDAGLAEEIAQETLLAVWRKAGYFDPARAGASTWIFTIARNLRIDRARRNGNATQSADDAALETAPEPIADELIAAAERDELVRRVVKDLPPEQSQIVKLSFFSETPQTEIAEMLGIPLGTVKSRVRLAMARLRKALEEFGAMINFHPSDEFLARLAAGSLEAGPSVVVRTHLGQCRQCAKAVARFEAVGGTLLDEIEPAELGRDALAQTLALLESPVPTQRPASPARQVPPNGPIELPPALQELDIGRWRWLAPGVRRSRVTIPYAPDADLVLYRIGPGRRLPHHGHAGAEYTQVLSGSFTDQAGRYVPGDLVEAGWLGGSPASGWAGRRMHLPCRSRRKNAAARRHRLADASVRLRSALQQRSNRRSSAAEQL